MEPSGNPLLRCWDAVGTFQVPLINLEVNELKEILWEKIQEPVIQRRLILVIVSIALLLDNMLYMVIVPIIPDYLRYVDSWGDLPTGVNFTDDADTPPVHHGQDSATGVLFASKAIVQLMVNPFSGALIDRIGYDIPMMIGLSIMFLSTSIFACGRSYSVLFIARSLQGVGSAFADTSGLAMIADRFTEENERAQALGIALAFISFGCLVAPPFGGALYQFAGKEIPFLILAFVCLVDGLMLLLVMKPIKQQLKEQKHLKKVPTIPIWKLFMDPYIAVCSGALMMSNVALAFLEPTISLWMEDNITHDNWKMGMIWLPAFFPHVFGVMLTVKLSKLFPNYQWLMVAVGLSLEGLSCLIIPFSTSYKMLMIPICIICFGIALVDTAILPTLGYIVDVRYVSVYGSIYAIADISYSLAYAIGPIVAGEVVEMIGFTWLNVIIAVSNLAYAPALMRLRNIYDFKPFQNEANILMADPPDKEYQTYAMQEQPIPVGNEYGRLQGQFETDVDGHVAIENENATFHQSQDTNPFRRPSQPTQDRNPFRQQQY
ncbi:vesicular acetylcholine transporter isoform X2 [Sipha flava]|jgi:DHA1 family vesicular acetylcholine transporter-like MFS transporter 3|uniref:Vesicular acetylcholine transporter n=1 Tax=Sipha flava TaxID=143950 RepID=A0A2S2QJZ0_9HEMI|nr:vesicular acetylcholine transporter isoform X2 [Sipha flava]